MKDPRQPAFAGVTEAFRAAGLANPFNDPGNIHAFHNLLDAWGAPREHGREGIPFDEAAFLAGLVNLNAPAIADADFAAAARLLGCSEAAVRAVAEVESRGAGFLQSGRPKILFERHWFHKLTRGKWSAAHPDISSSKPGGYGPSGEGQYKRLAKAAALDREAALESASWGAFQIMGFNHAQVGFADVEKMVAAMVASEGNHLAAFAAFVKTNSLADELQRLDWAGFARGYNGSNYRINRYDEKMAAAYRRHSA